LTGTGTTKRERLRQARRSELVDAALAVISAKGVVAATVDDIVTAANVAKGTFYLYFSTKDDVATAVADRLADGVVDRIEETAGIPDGDPVERLRALNGALREFGGGQHAGELVEILHRPENRRIHEQMSRRAFARLEPILIQVIGDGIDAGLFRGQDPRLAAAFVMGAISSLHDVVSQPEDLAAVTRQLDGFILRGLGYAGEIGS